MTTPCLCCGPSAVQRTTLPIYKTYHGEQQYLLNKKDVRFSCTHCKSNQSYECALYMVDRASRDVPRYLLLNDRYYKSIIPYYDGSVEPTSTVIMIDVCILCSLSSLIPEGTQRSTSYTPHLNLVKTTYASPAEDISNLNSNLIDDVTSGIASVQVSSQDKSTDTTPNNNDKNDFLRNTSIGKKKHIISQQRATHKSLPQDVTADDCMSYLREYNSVKQLRSMDVKKELKRNMKKKESYIQTMHPHRKKRKVRSQEKKKLKQGCQYTGALYFPHYQLIVTSQTVNSSLYMDLHGLAESREDGTPAVPHMVLSDEDAKALQQHYQHNGPIPYLGNDDFQIQELDEVESPEDSTKKRNWTVATMVLQQTKNIKKMNHNAGRRNVPLLELIGARILSFNKRIDADQVVIAGDFSRQDGEYTCTKLLINRLQRLVTNDMDDSMVEDMYNQLYFVAGRDGKEVTRTSGTNGITSPSTHMDLLSALHNNPSLLPNKVGACWIIPGKKMYYILYAKHTPEPEEHSIACTTYAPPMPGGSFILNGNALHKWQILGEMAYAKMLTTLTLKRLNEVRVSNSDSPIATGPIKFELRNIEYARQTFQLTNNSYTALCKAFISVNSMSLTWQVGEHNDHFNKKGESLENKVTFVVPSITDGIGRGGSLVDNQFVFELLDWQYAARTVRQYYVTNSVDMGLGPPRASGAQRHLDEFFATANGAAWVGHYDTFMAGNGLPHWDAQHGAL